MPRRRSAFSFEKRLRGVAAEVDGPPTFAEHTRHLRFTSLTPVDRKTCHNCGAVLSGQFCARCGQEDRPLDPSIRELLGEAGRELSDLDGRIFGSLRRLFFSPGALTKDYHYGRRAAWLPPIRLYLIVSIVYFVVLPLTGGLSVEIDVTGDTDEETLAELREFGFSSEEELDAFVDDLEATWLPRAMFVLMPLFAGLVHWAQRRSGHKFPYHVVFALHVHTAAFGALAVAALAAYPWSTDWIRAAFGLAGYAYVLGYVAVALRRVYGGSRARAAAQTVLICGAYWLATTLITTAFVVPALFAQR